MGAPRISVGGAALADGVIASRCETLVASRCLGGEACDAGGGAVVATMDALATAATPNRASARPNPPPTVAPLDRHTDLLQNYHRAACLRARNPEYTDSARYPASSSEQPNSRLHQPCQAAPLSSSRNTEHQRWEESILVEA
jgi:hypothetical protein